MRIRTLRDPPAPPLQFLVPGLIQKSALTVIAGPAGSGKSALVANLAVASAASEKWLGLPVAGGPVLWAAAEAAVSTEHRLRALGDRCTRIAIANDVPNLLDDGAFEALCVGLDEAAERLGGPIAVVVVDALASSMRGGDENSSRDMTRAMGVLLRLAEESAVSVVLIAHTGKGGDAHVRGHSSVTADATSVFSITQKERERHLVCLKQRDAEMSRPIPFRIIADGAALRAERATCGGDVERTDPKRPSPDAKKMLSELQEMGGQADWDALRARCQAAFGDTFKYVAPIAGAAGVSIEELGGAAMVLASGGTRGAEAGVALRSALVRMVKPSLDARQAMAELGMSFEDFASKWRELNVDELASGMKNVGFDVSKVMPKIRKSLEGLSLETDRGAIHETITDAIIKGLGVTRQTDQEKVAKAVGKYVSGHIQEIDLVGLFETLVDKDVAPGQMSRIFDQRQGTRLSNLLRPGKDSASELRDAVNEVNNSTGKTEWMAERRMDGIVGQVNRLTSAWVELNEAIARSGVLATVGDAFDRITASLNKLSAANPQLLRIGTYAGLAVIALAPLGMAFTALGGLVGGVVGAIGLIGSAIAVLGGPLTLVVGLLGVLGIAIYKNWDKISKMFSFFGEILSEAGSAIGEFASSMGSAIGNGIVAAAEWVGEAIIGLRDKIVIYLSNSLEAIGRIDLTGAGAAIMRSLWEGMKNIFSGLVGWVSGIPAAIRGALPGGGGGATASGGGAAPPARARGGQVSRGRSYIVGEHRPEIFTPGQAGYVNARVPDGGGGSRPVNVTQHITINGSGDQKSLMGKLRREMERAAEDAFRSINADARTSYGY